MEYHFLGTIGSKPFLREVCGKLSSFLAFQIEWKGKRGNRRREKRRRGKGKEEKGKGKITKSFSSSVVMEYQFSGTRGSKPFISAKYTKNFLWFSRTPQYSSTNKY
jgi:hypothetical protein